MNFSRENFSRLIEAARSAIRPLVELGDIPDVINVWHRTEIRYNPNSSTNRCEMTVGLSALPLGEDPPREDPGVLGYLHARGSSFEECEAILLERIDQEAVRIRENLEIIHQEAIDLSRD